MTKLATRPSSANPPNASKPPPPPAPPPRPAGASAGSPSRDEPGGGRRRPLWRRAAWAFGEARAALAEALDVFGAGRAVRRLNEFADAVAAAREPDRIEAALLEAAGRLSGACRVELTLDRDRQTDPDPKLLGVWPESASSMSPDEVDRLGYPLCLGLWCGDHYQMTIQLYARPGGLKGGRWSPRVVRRLRTLCAVAAAAERGLHASQRGRIEAPSDSAPAVRDATYLNAVLPYAISQAKRHREPLALFCIEVDGIAGLTRDHGAGAVAGAARRVADAASRALRGSDVVAQLDDGRVIVILSNAGGADALAVAAVVQSAVLSACLPEGGLPGLTASIGLASFPTDAQEMIGLLDAADDAMSRARSRGPNQIATTSAAPPFLPPAADSDAAPPWPAPQEGL